MMPTLHHIMRMLGDPTRLRIIALLQGRDELCVCELVEALRRPQYHVSRHLRALRSAGLVSGRRQGRWMHYRLNPSLHSADRALVHGICARARRERATSADLARLRRCLRPRVPGGRIAQRPVRRGKC